MLTWAARFDDVTFALEDCRHLTRRLEGDLLRAGQCVVRVPTRLMAQASRGARTPGKSDPIDAEAVAIAALRHPDLPAAELDGPDREIKLLSDHRRDLVTQRTRACCQLALAPARAQPRPAPALAQPAPGQHPGTDRRVLPGPGRRGVPTRTHTALQGRRPHPRDQGR